MQELYDLISNYVYSADIVGAMFAVQKLSILNKWSSEPLVFI